MNWLRIADFVRSGAHQFRQAGFSMADQALSAGGMFLVNLVLARSQSREEYGRFALSYSVLIFFLGLHNAAILEPFTVYGSGRYRARLGEYFQLMFWSNIVLGLLLTALVLITFLAFARIMPYSLPREILGLGISVSFLLSGVFVRRAFYLQHRAAWAAATSLIFLATVSLGIGLTVKLHRLDGFSVFLILAAGWLTAALALAKKLPFFEVGHRFLASEPGYWHQHWKYARWVLLTALVFQATTQGYYWVVAGILSVKDVAELKAVSLVVAPVDQIFIALNYLALPVLSAHFAAQRMAELRSAWKCYATAITAFTLCSFLFIRALGGPLTHLLYGGSYDDAVPLLVLLVLVPVITGAGHTMNAALKAAECPRLVFWAYAASGAVTFAAGLPLVMHFGVRGAAYGMLLSGGAYTLVLGAGFMTHIWRRPEQPMVESIPEHAAL